MQYCHSPVVDLNPVHGSFSNIENVDQCRPDETRMGHDGDAILMAQKLAAQLGLAVGISSGANFIGALMAQNDMGADAVVTTVFPDDNKKYLSTDLLREERSQTDYLTPKWSR